MAEEPMLKLIDGESIEVTPAGPAVNVVEMVVFNPKTDAVLNGSSPECSPKPDGSCSQEVDIPQDLKDLEVLVVALDKEGEVEESVLLPFYDMKVTTRQLTSDMLEVAWTANQPEDYSVSLLSSSPPLTDSSPSSLLSSSSSPSSSSSSLSSSPSSSSSSLSSSPSSSSSLSPSSSSSSSPPSSSLSSSSSSSSPTSSSSSLSPSSSSSLSPSLPSSPHAVPTPSSATEIKTTCNEGGCLAHFAGLVSGETYTVQVHKEGTDNLLTGATAHMDTPDEDLPPICPVESLTTDPGSATDITVNISSFAATVTSAYLGVRLEAEAREVSLEAVPLPGGADGIFEVTHEGQDLPAGQVMLVFKASDGTSNFCVSKTVVMLEVLDAQLSWVGEKYSANSSSLRVDTGTFKEITVQQGKVCKTEESPCYFLRDELPTTVPRCVTLTTDEGETISQCEDFVRPFKELPGEFSVSLDGNDKIVVAGAYPGNTTMEITIYDPLAPADIMSHGETSCEEVVAAGRSSSQRCSQVFNAPKDQRSLRVLVVAVGEGGEVEGSLLKEFTYTKQGVAVWIIVVSVLASVIVVALVGFGISTIVKKKKKAKQHKVNSTDSQGRYQNSAL